MEKRKKYAHKFRHIRKPYNKQGIETTVFHKCASRQCTLSGIHSIMTVKSVKVGTCAHPPPFTLSTITSNVMVYSPNERAGPYFSSIPICTLYVRSSPPAL